MLQREFRSFFNIKPHAGGLPVPYTCRLDAEDHFRSMLAAERKRAELLDSPFLLMLIDIAGLSQNGNTRKTFKKLLDAVDGATRETDIRGWYETNKILGIIFTGIEKDAVVVIVKKMAAAIAAIPDPAARSHARISSTLFPDILPAPQVAVKIRRAVS
jgi:hypothetical protein